MKKVLLLLILIYITLIVGYVFKSNPVVKQVNSKVSHYLPKLDPVLVFLSRQRMKSEVDKCNENYYSSQNHESTSNGSIKEIDTIAGNFTVPNNWKIYQYSLFGSNDCFPTNQVIHPSWSNKDSEDVILIGGVGLDECSFLSHQYSRCEELPKVDAVKNGSTVAVYTNSSNQEIISVFEKNIEDKKTP